MNSRQAIIKEAGIKLSICISTYNRGKVIGETLDSILSQINTGVELIVVDAASPDNTADVMSEYLLRHPQIRYYREKVNSGIDRDYDKAVGYAKGDYCWLMSDDDLLQTGSILQVLNSLKCNPDLVVVNAEVRNANFSKLLNSRILKFTTDRDYAEDDSEKFFLNAADYLSYIGGVVINRNLWLERDRATYYGTLFVHVGVIFQSPPLRKVKVISEPLITIRYGNAMWTARSFEIWMFKWPELIWGFSSFSNTLKYQICHPKPWKNAKSLIYNRALGAYSLNEYNKFIATKTIGIAKLLAFIISIFPATVINVAAILYFVIIKKSNQMAHNDLLRSRHASFVSRFAARFL